MNMQTDKEIIKNFSKSRRLKKGTQEQYTIALTIYSNFNKKSLHELLQEAENEEEQGIRWKHRKLKKRLLTFRNYLYQEYVKRTAENKFSLIKTFYTHYEIEIHELPNINKKNIRLSPPINFKDLPDKQLIKQALKLANPFMRAVILFMSSSGCARAETLSITIKDYLEATRQYHNKNNISDAIESMYNQDVIPIFYLLRKKTNKHYFTFCSPEANNEIINYLLTREKLELNDPLFKSNKTYFERQFANINNTLQLGKIGAHNRFRSHMLRKFHASQLYNDGMSLDEVDSLQGRGKDPTHNSYFMEDPERLKEKYIEHMNAITINMDINNINLKSPEYIQLENRYNEKEAEVRDMDSRLKRIESVFNKGGFDDIFDLMEK